MSFNPNEHLIQLKGKDYLQVMWRLVWLRAEHADWGINTELVQHDTENKFALFHAVITDGNGQLIASGHGSETARDFGDYIEKAETKAIGRALAMCGYGTQFTADELDEGSRIVDSPVDRSKKKAAEEAPQDYSKMTKPSDESTPANASQLTTLKMLCTDEEWAWFEERYGENGVRMNSAYCERAIAAKKEKSAK